MKQSTSYNLISYGHRIIVSRTKTIADLPIDDEKDKDHIFYAIHMGVTCDIHEEMDDLKMNIPEYALHKPA